MKTAKKKMPVQVITTKEQSSSYQKNIGLCCLTFLIAGGSYISMQKTMKSLHTGTAILLIVLIIGALSEAVAGYYKKKKNIALGIRIVPWILVLLITGFHGYWNGAKVWINGLITMWNKTYDGGAGLFAGRGTQHDIWAFSVLLALIIGKASSCIVARGWIILGEFWCIAWGVLALLTGTFDAVASSFLLAGILGLVINGKKVQITRMGVVWVLGVAVALFVCAKLTGNMKMTSVDQARENTKEKLHEIRYGISYFPEGDLYQSNALKEDDGKEFLKVTAEQEKTLYLKAFVGGVYESGEWKNMPDSVYGEENAGMLKWLQKKNFSPLTQSAAYYSVGKDKDVETNRVKVQVEDGSRDYFYAPASLKKITSGEVNEKKDQLLHTTGMFGENAYTWTELSGVRPSELMVAQDWVEYPQSKKQKEYSKAESVYRAFVYDHYTVVDKKMYKLANQIFWKDYVSDSDGIYSALTQVRKVLKEEYQYKEKIDEKNLNVTDPLKYFLEKSYEGNDMLYASAAVTAFRAHGIPARYVEGYYVSATDIAGSKKGVTTVSGKNAHAWMEVYFDGVGWLPVDVTPGYYYDVAALQKMVSVPQNVQKNAALENNSFGGKQSTDVSSVKSRAREGAKKVAKQTLMIMLGLLAFILLVLVILVSVVELLRICIQWRTRKKYESVDINKKAIIIEKELFRILKCFNIQSCLGWNAEETEQRLREYLKNIEPGEYKKVSGLLEKVIYGEIELENYELRTLESFMKKILEGSKTCNISIRIKLRYRYLLLQ